MSEPRRCSQCGAELAAHVPNSVCRVCSSKSPGEDRSAENVAATAPWAARFAAPKPEELARYFPQLEIVELLGQGGMGAVYKARQPSLDRLVAVKILPAEVASDPAFAERFSREARALARLNHPNIVAIHDFGQVDGVYYFVMEYVDGFSLRQLVNQRELTPPQALALVPQMCDALQFAHDEGIVHRDIKPENILIDQRGRVKIADFGLAKLLGRSGDQASLTRAEQVMGTPLYMAPEQLQSSRAVDHRADIYSLGVVFYEMLTGELPMGRFAPPSQKVELDVRLDEVVLRALEREPDRRYQHASDVKTDVDSIVARHAPVRPIRPRKVRCPPKLAVSATGMFFLSFLCVVLAPASNLRGWMFFFVLAAACAALAGWGMLRLRAYAFAVLVATLFFMAGFVGNPRNVFGALLGAWALVVLSQTDVRAVFGAARKMRSNARGAGAKPLLGCSHLAQPGDRLLLDEIDRSARPLQYICFTAGLILLGAMVVIQIAPYMSRKQGLPSVVGDSFIKASAEDRRIVEFWWAIILSSGGIALIVLAIRTRPLWEVDHRGHSIRFENGFVTSGRLMIDGEVAAVGRIGLRSDLSARIASGSGAGDRIVVMTDAGLLSLRCRILARSEMPFRSMPVV